VVLLLGALACGSPDAARAPTKAPPTVRYDYVESPAGAPETQGCADGQREGFADVEQYPRVAGCVGRWEGAASLRAPPTGQPCGDDLDGAPCNVPADACAPGWHACGHDGDKYDLSSRVSAGGCRKAGPGRFNAAMSHSPKEGFPCPPVLKSTVLPCMEVGVGSEPVCCGHDCKQGGCRDGVFRGRTRISLGTASGCGALFSTDNAGVLCCADGPS